MKVVWLWESPHAPTPSVRKPAVQTDRQSTGTGLDTGLCCIHLIRYMILSTEGLGHPQIRGSGGHTRKW